MQEENSFLHDLSTPLTVMKMNLENVRELAQKWPEEDGRKCEKLLDSLLRQTEKLIGLVRAQQQLLEPR